MKKISVIIIGVALLGVTSLVFSSCSNSNKGKNNQQTEEKTAGQTDKEQQFVADFYKQYITNVCAGMEDGEKNIALKEESLTEGLIEKLDRVVQATHADAILRAQDITDEALTSLTVEPLSEGWYMVKYTNAEYSIAIPVRVVNREGVMKIDYIVPEWNKEQYGNDVVCEGEVTANIDYSTPLAFVRSFYSAYAMAYCSVEPDLSLRTKEIREKCLTELAINKFNEADKDNEGIGYDLIIDNYDFDITWEPTIEVSDLGSNVYEVAYKSWGGSVENRVKLKVDRVDDKYMISDLMTN